MIHDYQNRCKGNTPDEKDAAPLMHTPPDRANNVSSAQQDAHLRGIEGRD
jgi:hypothetical protein